MGGTQRVAAVAAISHARHQYYNVTNDDVARGESAQYGVNIFFISATLCGVVIAVCAACWPRALPSDKPDDSYERGAHVYTVSDDVTLCSHHQIHDSPPGPPPAYDSVIDTSCRKDAMALQEIIIETNMVPSYPAHQQQRPDTGLPSYEAAVMLRDTKL